MVQSLFEAAREDLADEVFTQKVVHKVRSRGRRVLVVQLGIAAMLVLIELLLESPLQETLGTIGDVLSTPLLAVRNDWLGFFVAPFNSVAGLLALLLVGTHYLYRRIVR